jgi:hypothetical protein
MTVKFVVALKFGAPLSVTMTVMTFVLGPFVSPGVSVIAPLFVSIATHDGAPDSEYVSTFGGKSVSVAVAEMFVTVSSSITTNG